MPSNPASRASANRSAYDSSFGSIEMRTALRMPAPGVDCAASREPAKRERAGGERLDKLAPGESRIATSQKRRRRSH